MVMPPATKLLPPVWPRRAFLHVSFIGGDVGSFCLICMFLLFCDGEERLKMVEEPKKRILIVSKFMLTSSVAFKDVLNVLNVCQLEN